MGDAPPFCSAANALGPVSNVVLGGPRTTLPIETTQKPRTLSVKLGNAISAALDEQTKDHKCSRKLEGVFSGNGLQSWAFDSTCSAGFGRLTFNANQHSDACYGLLQSRSPESPIAV